MRPWKTAAGVLGLVLVIAVAPLASAQPAGVTNIDYIFSAHPDDEYQGYSRIDGVTDDYRVFVYMTRGEQSSYCRTASDPELHYAAYQEGQGPWGYQGPNAAVPQFDRGELEPRFNGLSPWGGQWTPGCVEARVQGTLLMLDALAAQDTGQPVTFDKRGRFYGGLYYNSSVVVPRRYDSHSNVDNPTGITNYVNVYLASNGRGAAVFFDLGDADLTQSEARWALDTTLARGGEWGFPALTRDDVMANYYNRSHPECFLYSENTPGGGGRDHGAVHRAVWDAMGEIGRAHV